MSNNLSSVLIIYTGGTIGMAHDPDTGSMVPLNFEHIKKQVPELNRLECSIDTIAFDPLIDSSEISPLHWIRIAEIIEEKYRLYDGFVVLHGTDTMAYSASALSFLLDNLEKPVIFTGSQLPIGKIRTDGRENLVTAIEIASAKKDDKAIVPEVSIYFENKLLRGNRTTKYSTDHFNAFDSPNFSPLAEAGVEIKYSYNNIRYPTVRRNLEVTKMMDQEISILKLFPGITKNTVAAIAGITGLKGLIIESFGAGNAPTTDWFLGEISNFISREGVVINISQCPKGPVMPEIYETGRKLSELGVISGGDMTTEAAVTKLMYLLPNCNDSELIKKMLRRSLKGEITV